MKKSNGGIARRLLLYFLLISLIPILSLEFLVIYYTNRISVDRLKAEMTADIHSNGVHLKNDMENLSVSMQMLSDDDDIVRLLLESDFSEEDAIKANQKMYLIMAGRSKTLSMQIIDTTGKVIHSTNRVKDHSEQANVNWGLLRALKNSDEIICYPGIYGGSERGITIAVPVYHSSKVVGYVLLGISEQAIKQDLNQIDTGVHPEYILVDRNYYMLFNQTSAKDSELFLSKDLRGQFGNSSGDVSFINDTGNEKMFSYVDLGVFDLRLAASASVGFIFSSNHTLVLIMLSAALISLIICIFASKAFSGEIVKPIHIICDSMEKIENGCMDVTVPDLGNNEFGMMAKGFNHMFSQLKEQFRINMERQERLRIAEFKNLQAQISPHFINNTLESIKYMAKLGMIDEMEDMISKLAILLKNRMHLSRDMVPLREEMRAVESYIDIQQIRYEGKFEYENLIPNDLMDLYVPNLILQPLVENAIVHGLEMKIGKGHLQISAASDGNNLDITIYDDGIGIDENRIREILKSSSSQETINEINNDSIGMANVNKRLKLYFGNEYGLSVKSVPGEYTYVYLRMKVVKNVQSNHY